MPEPGRETKAKLLGVLLKMLRLTLLEGGIRRYACALSMQLACPELSPRY
jgi:hypothetical protein